jgi:hypothetical protein
LAYSDILADRWDVLDLMPDLKITNEVFDHQRAGNASGEIKVLAA